MPDREELSDYEVERRRWGEALRRAIVLAGGAKLVAETLGVPLSTVYFWRRTGRMPADDGMVLALEKLVESKVTRYQIRPDVYGRPK